MYQHPRVYVYLIVGCEVARRASRTKGEMLTSASTKVLAFASARAWPALRPSVRALSTGYIFPSDRAPYKGVRVAVPQLFKDLGADVGVAPFADALARSTAQWRASGVRAVWLPLDIGRGDLIAAAAEQGFRFHHASGSKAMLVTWLPTDQPDSIPLYATHQIGVGGIVVDGDKVLTIRERNGSRA